MKTAICCIIKQENLYLREWVEYHKNIGVDAIILYDNNDKEGEYPQQVIGDYIKDSYVIYKDVRGLHRYQMSAYNQCFQEYKEEFDWIGFFDVDEYIELPKYKNIKYFLEQDSFKRCDFITMYWEIYGDNGLIHYDNRPIYERFKIPNAHGEKNNYKLFVRGINSSLTHLEFIDCGIVTYYYIAPVIWKDTNGNEYSDGENFYLRGVYDNAFLKHFNTLTIEEFLYRRFGRKSYADNMSSFNKDVIMNIFTQINEITPEKQIIIDDFFNKFDIKEDNV